MAGGAAAATPRVGDDRGAGLHRFLPRCPFCTQGQQQHEIGFIQRGIVRYHVALPSGDDQHFGAQIDRIAQHQLASYLGIRPPSLSRLKRALLA